MPLATSALRYADVTVEKRGCESRVLFMQAARALTDAARRLNMLSRRKRRQQQLLHRSSEASGDGGDAMTVEAFVALPIEMHRIQLSGIKDAKAVTRQANRARAACVLPHTLA